MKHRNGFGTVLILGLLSAIGPFSIDMYLPGFPAIAHDLHSDISHISLSLSSFFIGISAGQFIYGPLLDRFGRKKPLLIGLCAYLIASAGCAFATSADALIALRFLQALGSCSGMVASRAMVRDLYEVKDSAKVFSLLMLVVGVSPLIAPTVGGYLAAGPGWRYIFIVLTVVAAAILAAVYFTLRETRGPDENFSLKPAPITAGFLDVLKDPQFYTYAFTGAIASAGLYAYIAGSPYVFMELFKVSERHYGWIFAFVAMGLIASSQLNSLFLRTYSSAQIIKVALTCQTICGLLLVAGSAAHLLHVGTTIALIFIFLCCQGFTFPNTSALSLAPFPKRAGSASALLGGIQMGLGAFTAALVSLLHNGTAIPMTGVMAACAATALLILFAGSRALRAFVVG